MNKHESKYFNTAKLMDDALVYLLLKKDFELITIKDICSKAGVNRSTFYLHYDNIIDVLKECVERCNEEFLLSFKHKNNEKIDIDSQDTEKLILIKEEYLLPYLKFVKENKNLFKAAHTHPELFNTKRTYEAMFENIFNPILKRFGFCEEDNKYIMEYYIKGTSSLILKWASNDCQEDINKIIELILICIRPNIGKEYENN